MVRKKVVKRSARKRASPKRRKSVQNKVVSLKLKASDSLRLDAKKFGNALGKVSALCIFIVSILAMSGRAPGWVMLADVMYGPLGYWPGRFLLGVVWGTVLAYVDGFVIGWLIAKIYNKSGGCLLLRR
mgnify:CR=1 FL=1|jgi:hypothetical protein